MSKKAIIIVFRDKVLFKVIRDKITNVVVGFDWVKNNDKRKIYILDKKTASFSAVDSLYKLEDFDLNYKTYHKVDSVELMKELIK